MNSESSGLRRSRLAIVGGGYLGSELARSLDNEMDVTLIERASHFTHAPAIIRAMIDPGLLERALIPYANLLKQGHVHRGEAVSVDGGGVTLADGAKIDANYIVLATGSTNMAPFRSASGNIESLRADNLRWHNALASARSVLIIGAGAVGTEVAGEIAHAHPEKQVTLVSSDTSLFQGFPPGFGRSLQKKLRGMGVELVLGARAENVPARDLPDGGRVVLSTGRTLEADLLVPAVGSQPIAGLAETLPGAEFDSAGRIVVDGWMRPSRLPNVFAAGDAAACGDAMTIVAISRQRPWLTKTLRALCAGRTVDSIRPYTSWSRAPILLPLGPRRGNSFLMVLTVGDWMTRMMKGRDLFLKKYNRLLGFGQET